MHCSPSGPQKRCCCSFAAGITLSSSPLAVDWPGRYQRQQHKEQVGSTPSGTANFNTFSPHRKKSINMGVGGRSVGLQHQPPRFSPAFSWSIEIKKNCKSEKLQILCTSLGSFSEPFSPTSLKQPPGRARREKHEKLINIDEIPARWSRILLLLDAG